MRPNTILVSVLAISFVTTSCDFSKSVYKDLKTGMVTRGNGLSCDNVYLSVNDEKVSRSTFTYGETMYIYFENIEGFNRLDRLAFPGMQITLTGMNGDTVLHSGDVYADQSGGFNFTPLTLSANLILMTPIHSGNEYHLNVNIWDKQEPERSFSADMDMEIIHDQKIEVESNQIRCSEVYLYSRERKLSLTDHVARQDEYIYLNMEGIEGMIVEDGNVLAGTSMVVKDADGNVLIDEPDLIGDSAVPYSDIKERLSPNFIISGDVSSPVSCKVTVWDKNGEGSITVYTELTVL
jgi:hypothetical protein